MPRSTTGRDKAPAKTSPARKQGRSRSRTRVETTNDDNSRAPSPPRRGRPPGRRSSRSPSRSTKAILSKNEVALRRTQQNLIGTEQTDAATLLRARKKPEMTVVDDHNHHGTVPNGTHLLTVDIEKLSDPYARKLRSADAPRTPKINTSIFDNIQLTPSVKPVSTIGQKLATPVPSKMVPKQQSVKKAFDNCYAWTRKSLRKCYSMLPSWEVMLGIFLGMAMLCLCLYVYYHWDTVVDYYTIAKAEVQRQIQKWGTFEGVSKKDL